MSPIEPFRTAVHPDVLEDLHDRPGIVAKSRSSGCEPGADHSSIDAMTRPNGTTICNAGPKCRQVGHFAAMEEPGPLVTFEASFVNAGGPNCLPLARLRAIEAVGPSWQDGLLAGGLGPERVSEMHPFRRWPWHLKEVSVNQNPASATAMIPTSALLNQRTGRALSSLSATCQAGAENRK